MSTWFWKVTIAIMIVDGNVVHEGCILLSRRSWKVTWYRKVTYCCHDDRQR